MFSLQSLFNLKIQTHPDTTTTPSATTHPLVLELHHDNRAIATDICQVLQHAGTGRILHASSTELDLQDGTLPRQLIHIGFHPEYIARSFSHTNVDLLSDSEQKVHLLAFVRRVRLEPTTAFGRHVLFADDKLPQNMHTAFEAMDVDKSGFIDIKELERIVPNHRLARAILQEYDTDGDGTINYQEWLRHGLVDFLTCHGMLVRTFLRHDHVLRERLQQKWSSNHRWGLSIPRPDALAYLGRDCTMYFEFVTFYTWSITGVAFLGLLLHLGGHSGPWMLGFALFSGVWSSVVLCLWSQRQFGLEQLWRPNQAQRAFLSLAAFDLYSSKKNTGHYVQGRRLATMVGSLLMLAVVFWVDLKILHFKIALDNELNQVNENGRLPTRTAEDGYSHHYACPLLPLPLTPTVNPHC
jgi:hypothetical protein